MEILFNVFFGNSNRWSTPINSDTGDRDIEGVCNYYRSTRRKFYDDRQKQGFDFFIIATSNAEYTKVKIVSRYILHYESTKIIDKNIRKRNM